MKISKKLEKMCRALATTKLLEISFPKDLIDNKVTETWPGYMEKAKLVIYCINQIQDYELDGETTTEEIEKWSS